MKPKNGTKRSAMDRLIEQSVAQALATWLSGQAIRTTEELAREVWTDEDFRRDFMASVREAAKRTLERLKDDKP